VTDLSPLAEFALEELRVKEISVTDLSVPESCSIVRFRHETLDRTSQVADFSPVTACKRLRIFSAFPTLP
jgi:hypothetical protein